MRRDKEHAVTRPLMTNVPGRKKGLMPAEGTTHGSQRCRGDKQGDTEEDNQQPLHMKDLTRLPPRESTLDGRWTRKPFGLSSVQPIYLSVSEEKVEDQPTPNPTRNACIKNHTSDFHCDVLFSCRMSREPMQDHVVY